MNKKRLLMMMGGSKFVLNKLCPTITPTFGTEEISNGEFTTDTTGWTENNATISVVDSASDPGTVSGGADSNCLKIVDAGGEAGVTTPNLVLTAKTWHMASALLYSPSANLQTNVATIIAEFQNGGENYGRKNTSIENVWQNIFFTFFAVMTTCYVDITVYGGINDDVIYADKVSVVPLALAEVTSLIGSTVAQTGAYGCSPIVTVNTQAGIIIEYKDALNYVIAYIDRNIGKAVLQRCNAGTYTSVIAETVTYSAGATLCVVVDGTNHSLYYNGTQVGTTQVIDNSGMGLAVYGFSTHATNAVGTVKVKKAASPF